MIQHTKLMTIMTLTSRIQDIESIIPHHLNNSKTYAIIYQLFNAMSCPEVQERNLLFTGIQS